MTNENDHPPPGNDPTTLFDTATLEVDQPAAKLAALDTIPDGAAHATVTQDRSQRRSLAERLASIERNTSAPLRDMAAMRQEIERIKIEHHVLTEMHDRCTHLTEQHDEREILLPSFRVLIGIADRCRQQSERMQGLLGKHSNSNNKAALLAIRHIMEARSADRLEVESALANYGVEPYETLADKFDPSRQKCIRRIESTCSEQDGTVCQRLLPGYKRHGKILRQEYVSVYVLPKSKAAQKAGEKP